MSKRVYLVTLHTGNSLTVHSVKFTRGRTVVVEDENLVNYLKGHPNFTIVPQNVGEETTPEEVEAAMNGGVNTSEDLEPVAKSPVTNVAKNPTPVKRGRSSAASVAQ